jgi:hypothetical protein
LRMRLTAHSQACPSACLDDSKRILPVTQRPTARAVSFDGLQRPLARLCKAASQTCRQAIRNGHRITAEASFGGAIHICGSSDFSRRNTANGSAKGIIRQIARHRDAPQERAFHDDARPMGWRKFAATKSSRTRSSRLVAMARMHPNPLPVGILEVTAVAVIIIAVPAPFTLTGNGSPRPRPDDRTDCRTAASADGATDDGSSGSPEYGAAKSILSRRLLSRHRQSRSQQRRNSQISKHPVILHSVGSACSHPHCGKSLRQADGGNRPPSRRHVHTVRLATGIDPVSHNALQAG